MVKISNIVCAIVVGLLLTPFVFSQADLPSIKEAGFNPVAPSLKGKTLVPVVMPSALPKGNEFAIRFFCTVTIAKREEYEVMIGAQADCDGGNYCRIGSLYGKRSRSSRIEGSENYPFDRSEALRVKLFGGIVGYYVEGECGASCEDDKVFWKKGEFEYMVGLKAGGMAEVVSFANAAIRNSR